MDTMEVKIYDEQGNFITEMNYTQHAILSLMHGVDNKSYFAMQDSGTNIDFLKTLSLETRTPSDFEKATNKKTVLSFNKDSIKGKEYRIVANGIMYDHETAVISKTFDIVIYKAKLTSGVSLFGLNGDAHCPEYVFELFEDTALNFVDLEITEV